MSLRVRCQNFVAARDNQHQFFEFGIAEQFQL